MNENTNIVQYISQFIREIDDNININKRNYHKFGEVTIRWKEEILISWKCYFLMTPLFVSRSVDLPPVGSSTGW